MAPIVSLYETMHHESQRASPDDFRFSVRIVNSYENWIYYQDNNSSSLEKLKKSVFLFEEIREDLTERYNSHLSSLISRNFCFQITYNDNFVCRVNVLTFILDFLVKCLTETVLYDEMDEETLEQLIVKVCDLRQGIRQILDEDYGEQWFNSIIK